MGDGTHFCFGTKISYYKVYVIEKLSYNLKQAKAQRIPVQNNSDNYI